MIKRLFIFLLATVVLFVCSPSTFADMIVAWGVNDYGLVSNVLLGDDFTAVAAGQERLRRESNRDTNSKQKDVDFPDIGIGLGIIVGIVFLYFITRCPACGQILGLKKQGKGKICWMRDNPLVFFHLSNGNTNAKDVVIRSGE